MFKMKYYAFITFLITRKYLFFKEKKYDEIYYNGTCRFDDPHGCF